MKHVTTAILGALLLAGCAAHGGVEIGMGPRGLASLAVRDQSLLADGALRVTGCVMQRWDGSSYAADLTGGKTAVDRGKGRVTHCYPWGAVSATYQAAADRLNVVIDVTNESPDTIASLHLRLMDLAFPKGAEPRNPAFRTPWMANKLKTARAMAHNVGEPSVIVADCGAAVLALCNEDVGRPLSVGFAPAEKDTPTVRPLLVYTGRHAVCPEWYPFIDRPIYPGRSDRYTLSLRFAAPGTDPEDLAGDVYRKFAAAYPFRLKWTDRRPIGQIFLCRSGTGWKTNPRGWFSDPKVDVTTEEGLAQFRKRFLAYAVGCVKIMKGMDAQGVIFWDLEGQEHPHAISYLGDPRSLPPELGDGLIDSFLKKFTDAGFRVGLTIRPQRPVRAAYDDKAFQIVTDDPVGNLIDKIAHAKKRWGCSIFYFDSDVYWKPDPKLEGIAPGASLLLGAEELGRVTAAHPDVLIIPEIEDAHNYAYGAPYVQMNYDGLAGTHESVRRIYREAFCVLNLADTKDIDQRWGEVVAAVRRGDILFYRTWFNDSWNDKVKRIYAEAKAGGPATRPAK